MNSECSGCRAVFQQRLGMLGKAAGERQTHGAAVTMFYVSNNRSPVGRPGKISGDWTTIALMHRDSGR